MWTKHADTLKDSRLDDAIERTVEECIRENVLRDFLLENKSEVKKMCLYEYDEEQQRKWDREDGRKEEERNRMVKVLLRQGILSDEKIMEVAEISEEELFIKKEGFFFL